MVGQGLLFVITIIMTMLIVVSRRIVVVDRRIIKRSNHFKIFDFRASLAATKLNFKKQTLKAPTMA